MNLPSIVKYLQLNFMSSWKLTQIILNATAFQDNVSFLVGILNLLEVHIKWTETDTGSTLSIAYDDEVKKFSLMLLALG